jgi:hypothetical protein
LRSRLIHLLSEVGILKGKVQTGCDLLSKGIHLLSRNSKLEIHHSYEELSIMSLFLKKSRTNTHFDLSF